MWFRVQLIALRQVLASIDLVIALLIRLRVSIGRLIGWTKRRMGRTSMLDRQQERAVLNRVMDLARALRLCEKEFREIWLSIMRITRRAQQ